MTAKSCRWWRGGHKWMERGDFTRSGYKVLHCIKCGVKNLA